jgi:hypothetical protein
MQGIVRAVCFHTRHYNVTFVFFTPKPTWEPFPAQLMQGEAINACWFSWVALLHEI